MAKIEIRIAGDIYPVRVDRIKKFGANSSIFSIININKCPIEELDPNAGNPWLTETDFVNVASDENADFTVVILNRSLEGDYFTWPMSDRIIAISLSGIDDLRFHDGISFDNYVIRFLLAFSAMFKAYGNMSWDAANLLHDETKGCLFDKSVFKSEIAVFFRNPHISVSAKQKLFDRGLNWKFVETLETEVKKIRIGRYYCIRDWLKENPIWSIFLTFILGSVLMEIVGSAAYDWLTGLGKSPSSVPNKLEESSVDVIADTMALAQETVVGIVDSLGSSFLSCPAFRGNNLWVIDNYEASSVLGMSEGLASILIPAGIAIQMIVQSS